MTESGFQPLKLQVLTVSDSRTEATDKSGAYLVSAAEAAGHEIWQKKICPDDIYQIRAIVSAAIADPSCDAVVVTGGTGVTGRDGTPEAVRPLLDKVIDGFGELFRSVSFEEIGPSTIQSRALAGTAGGTLVFSLPGSTGACKTAWKNILEPQLDARTRPCNLAQLIPRLQET